MRPWTDRDTALGVELGERVMLRWWFTGAWRDGWLHWERDPRDRGDCAARSTSFWWGK